MNSPFADYVIQLGKTLSIALLTLVFGWWIISKTVGFLAKRMKASGLEPSVVKFTKPIVSIVLKAALLISVFSSLGFQTTSFMAILGSAGLAIGLALQGSLANIAGGLLILVLKPFRPSEVIEAQGVIAQVREIGVFTTTLVNAQQRTITIPNGPLSNSIIINYTRQGTLRGEIPVGISYGANIKTARDTIMEVMAKDSRILPEPAPVVLVTGLGDSSVNLAVRFHTVTADNWPVTFDLTENIKLSLDAAGVEIPFPQRVVHMKTN